MAYAYQIVVEAILARIRSGEWREGEQIPPLAELEKLYPQSRMTLYKALQHLTDRGHLTMSRGRGTFVRAAHPRRRIAILTGSEVFGQGVATFAMQAFIHAHEFFAERGMDAQLYTEAPNSPMSMPAGLLEELERRKLSGIMTVMAGFPWRFMNEPQWKAFAIPHVHLGPGPVDHALDVDRGAFLDLALRSPCSSAASTSRSTPSSSSAAARTWA
ncbi:MAG: GntR family transcriptional regulator [Planctomycetota bacterium]|nr:GntR family transcriptional regulator [Planctomycetota bacterium]